MDKHPSCYRAGYYAAVSDENDAAASALAAIRAEEAEGRITPAEAAAERVTLLEQHLARLAALRTEYLGGQP